MIPGRSSTRRRGQPVAALVLLLGGWVGVRAAILEQQDLQPGDAPAEFASSAAPLSPAKSAETRGMDQVPEAAVQGAARWPSAPLPDAAPGLLPDDGAAGAAPLPQSVPVRESAAAPGAEAPTPVRVGGGHQLLWMAGLSMLPLPVEAGLAQNQPPAPLRPLAPVGAGRKAHGASAPLRWSADGWIVWRQGGNGFNLPGAGLPGASVPSGAYGASQTGVVVRYRLAPSSVMRPTLYLRGSSALQAPRGEEVAGGFSLHPLKGIPVAAMGEVRATRTVGGNVIVRPAAALVSEFPVQQLPFGLRAEAYVQAGYVGGQDATPFVDGQARIERPLVQMGPVELRAGGGLWGGAQNGAQRLDVGPTATLAVPIGPGGSRVSADWRFRVAGGAAPGSGPAITLSAGF